MTAARIDYFDDPTAPAANSMVPSVNFVVANEAGQILLIRRTDNGNWAVPGGAIDLGESMVDAAVRETREESGLDCEITALVGIFTDPRHLIHYTSNDEVRQDSRSCWLGGSSMANRRRAANLARCGGSG
jgi:ADP-ribose pyrophosphatase YjhB (NUDIX family)